VGSAESEGRAKSDGVNGFHHRWDAADYQRIAATRFEQGVVIVRFADDDEARVAPSQLLPDPDAGADWPRLDHEDYHLIVPAPGGVIEVP